MNKVDMPLTLYRDITLVFVGLTGVILLVTFLISFWTSFRYGSPLFIFFKLAQPDGEWKL